MMGQTNFLLKARLCARPSRPPACIILDAILDQQGSACLRVSPGP